VRPSRFLVTQKPRHANILKNNELSSIHDQTFARATAKEKVANGEFILQVAERIIRDEGLEALSMNRLVQETGFAKGTLYLYFTTRHEILASLFAHRLMAWHNRLGESLTKARNYDEFCARYLRELIYDPLFLPMLVLERHDRETGLPDDTYAQVSLALQQVLGELAEVFKETLDLTDQFASNLVWAFYTAALGAAQFPQSPNMRASVSFGVREVQEALRFDTLFRNLVDQFAP